MWYDPGWRLGEIISHTLPLTLTDRLWTGMQRDATIGLYRAAAGWYDPYSTQGIYAGVSVPQAPAGLSLGGNQRPIPAQAGDNLLGALAGSTAVEAYKAGVGQAAMAAMRIKVTGETDELYYLHGDHAGSTVLLTDADGVPAGRAIYDAGWRLGGIVTSTFSVTLANRLDGGQPFDALTNLTYHGDGRYYDLLLGKHLQPDLAGSSPLIPQAADAPAWGRHTGAPHWPFHRHVLSRPRGA